MRKLKESEVQETKDHKIIDTAKYIWIHVNQLPKYMRDRLATGVNWFKVTRTWFREIVVAESPA